MAPITVTVSCYFQEIEQKVKTLSIQIKKGETIRDLLESVATRLSNLTKPQKGELCLSYEKSAHEVIDNVVYFNMLPAEHILTFLDEGERFVLFRANKVINKVNRLDICVHTLTSKQNGYSELLPGCFKFNWELTGGQLVYFLEKHFQKPELHQKMIFLIDKDGNSKRLVNFSTRLFPFTKLVRVFENVECRSFASDLLTAPVSSEGDLTVSYCYSFDQFNKEEAIIWRSQLKPTETNLDQVLDRFNQEGPKHIIFDHKGTISLNGVISHDHSNTQLPTNFNNNIIIFAEKLRCNEHFACQRGVNGHKISGKACSQCGTHFGRAGLKWCEKMGCSACFCPRCEFVLSSHRCDHPFSPIQKKGIKFEYYLYHTAHTFSNLAWGNVCVRNAQEFLKQVLPNLEQKFQTYEYISVLGKSGYIHFTKDSEMAKEDATKIFEENGRNEIRLCQGKHWCDCGDLGYFTGDLICCNCGLEKLPELDLIQLGKGVSISVHFENHEQSFLAGETSRSQSLGNVLNEILKRLKEFANTDPTREQFCIKFHYFQVKKSCKKNTSKFCPFSKKPSDLKPLFPPTKKISQPLIKIWLLTEESCDHFHVGSHSSPLELSLLSLPDLISSTSSQQTQHKSSHKRKRDSVSKEK